jgi:hypothetical protein
MFRKMRREKQLLSMEDIKMVMGRGTNGALACIGNENFLMHAAHLCLFT